MEFEVRFYFPKKQVEQLLGKLQKTKELKQSLRTYEKTIQFDYASPEMSFYRPEIDGRFRLRLSQNNECRRCKISWKRRLPETTITEVNREEEVELTIQADEYEKTLFLLEKVLKMSAVESYERYRTTFSDQEIEIALDEYPFGVALEIEAKNNNSETVKTWAKKLDLDLKEAYRLSWDDKYGELCRKQNIRQLKHVTFDAKMPEVK